MTAGDIIRFPSAKALWMVIGPGGDEVCLQQAVPCPDGGNYIAFGGYAHRPRVEVETKAELYEAARR